MNNYDDDNGIPPTTEAEPQPHSPRFSCVVVGSLMIFITLLITLSTFGFLIFALLLLWTLQLRDWFRGVNLVIDDIDDLDDVNGDAEEDEKAVEILERFLRAVKTRESRRKQIKRDDNDESKKVVGPIGYFGSEEIAELGYTECTICLEDFQKGEKCLVFPDCSHIFHCKCIVRWLNEKKKKLTCPLCRYSIAS